MSPMIFLCNLPWQPGSLGIFTRHDLKLPGSGEPERGGERSPALSGDRIIPACTLVASISMLDQIIYST